MIIIIRIYTFFIIIWFELKVKYRKINDMAVYMIGESSRKCFFILKGEKNMSMKFLKKILAVTLAASLMVAPAVTAGAASTDSSSSGSESTAQSSQSSQDSSSSTATTSTSTVAGVGTSTVGGAYSVKNLGGVAVREPATAIASKAGMTANEKPYVRAYDITAKQSPAAFVSINSAASSVGGTVIGAVNIDLGKLTGGKFTQLPDGVSVQTTIGIPGGKVDSSKTYAIVKVLPGGATEIIADQDTNPNTVTFNITGGLAAYAIIAY